MHDLNQVSLWLLCTKSIVLDAWTILSFLWFKKTKMKTNWSTQAPSVKELIQQFSVSLKTKYDYFHVTSLMRRFGKCHVCINRKTVWYCMYIFICFYEFVWIAHLHGPQAWLTDCESKKLTWVDIKVRCCSAKVDNVDNSFSFSRHWQFWQVQLPTLADPLVQVEWSWSTCSWERSLGTRWWWRWGGG